LRRLDNKDLPESEAKRRSWQSPGYRLSVIGYRLSVIGYRLSVIGYRKIIFKVVIKTGDRKSVD